MVGGRVQSRRTSKPKATLSPENLVALLIGVCPELAPERLVAVRDAFAVATSPTEDYQPVKSLAIDILITTSALTYSVKTSDYKAHQAWTPESTGYQPYLMLISRPGKKR